MKGQKENIRNHIRRNPTTPATSSSPTDLERLNANVSSRDGLRKPLLSSYKHKCSPPESWRDKRNLPQHSTIQLGPGDPPTQRTHNTLFQPHPDSSTLPYPPEGDPTTTKPPKAWPLTRNLSARIGWRLNTPATGCVVRCINGVRTLLPTNVKFSTPTVTPLHLNTSTTANAF